ncbi:MAG: RNA polymerase sigma factor [Bacteroidota bacterium]
MKFGIPLLRLNLLHDKPSNLHNSMSEYSDEELIQLFTDESSRHFAYNTLVKKHQQKAYYYIRRLVIDHDDANDVVQEVFLKIWHSLPKFRGDSKFTTWLYRICTNESIDHLKRQRKSIFTSIENVQQSLAARIDDDVLYDGDEIRKKLDKAVLGLPNKQRIIFTLKYFEEKKFSEISAITGTTEGALKASYHHAVKKIEDFMKRD